jgi:hypothetical protein
MLIVTDADVDFLAPLGAAYKLSAEIFRPYGLPELGHLQPRSGCDGEPRVAVLRYAG